MLDTFAVEFSWTLPRPSSTVWHPGLIYKLLATNIPKHYIRLIHSFLSGRFFHLKLGDRHPPFYRRRRFTRLSNLANPFAFYADDNTALLHTEDIWLLLLHRHLFVNDLTIWLCDWRIKVNTPKTKVIIFTKPYARRDSYIGFPEYLLFNKPRKMH